MIVEHGYKPAVTNTVQNVTTASEKESAVHRLLLILLTIAGVITVFGMNPEGYISHQKEWFIALNAGLSAFPDFWLNATALGDALVLLPLFSVFIVVNSRAWGALLSSIPLAILLSQLGKAFFSMPRPASVLDIQQFVVLGDAVQRHTALPSGHTVTIFTAITAVVGVLLYEKRTPRVLVFSALLFFAASVIALSRVAVGAHWPIDLLLGAILGAFAGLSGVRLTFKYKHWWKRQSVQKHCHIHAAIIWLFCLIMLTEYPGLMISWVSCATAVTVLFYLLTVKDWS